MGKKGAKIIVIVDDYGIPINIDIKNGNCSDILLLKPLINKSIMHNNDSFIKKYIFLYETNKLCNYNI